MDLGLKINPVDYCNIQHSFKHSQSSWYASDTVAIVKDTKKKSIAYPLGNFT